MRNNVRQIHSRWRYAPVVSAIIAALAALSAPMAYAQQATPQQGTSPKEKAANQQQGTGWQFDAGYRIFNGSSRHSYYYRLANNGNVIKQDGKPYDDTPTFTGAEAPTKPDANGYDFMLRLERGAGALDGPIFNTLGVRPIPITIPGLGPLRGAIQAYGKLNDSQIHLAAGLEAPALHLPLAQPASNFLILGVQEGTMSTGSSGTSTSQTSTAGTSGSTKDVSLATGRAFYGLLFGNQVKSDRLVKRETEMNSYLGSLADYDALRQQVFQDKEVSGLTDSKKILKRALTELSLIRRIDATNLSEVKVTQFLTLLQGNDSDVPSGGTEAAIRNDLRDYLRNPGVPPHPDFADLLDSTKSNPTTFTNFDLLKNALNGYVERVSLDAHKLQSLKIDASDRLYRLVDFSEMKKIASPAFKATVKERTSERQFANHLLLERGFNVTGKPVAIVSLITSDPAFDEAVKDAGFLQYAKSFSPPPDRFQEQLWLEDAGQFYFANGPSGYRWGNLFAATLTHYFNPASDKRQWFRVRYEKGRERAEPEVYRNQTTLLLGLDL